MRRFLVALLGFAFAGCVQVPYCIPELNYAPAVDAKCKKGEVYAFRVDITQKATIKDKLGGAQLGEVVDHVELTHLKTTTAGTTSPQMGVTFASGWRYVGFVNFTPSSTGHAIALRFYRPGYGTILTKPGENVRELNWKLAPDFGAQVKALDDLFEGTVPQKSASVIVRQVLEPGTKSATHKQALLFGAGEYDRLAAEGGMMRVELAARAARLRDLAEGK